MADSVLLLNLSLQRAPAGQRGEIEAEVGRLRREAAAAAVALSRQRRAAAGHLRVAVESCLAELAMSGSRFDVRIGWEPWPQVRRQPFSQQQRKTPSLCV